eukprot:1993951-Alexandrium_andersonii.AAC.1
MPLALRLAQRRGPVHQGAQGPLVLVALAHDPAHRNLGRVSAGLVGAAVRRQAALPSRSGADGSLLVRDGKLVRLDEQLLQRVDRRLLLL